MSCTHREMITWDCGCTWGCSCCELRYECIKCNRRFKGVPNKKLTRVYDPSNKEYRAAYKRCYSTDNYR